MLTAHTIIWLAKTAWLRFGFMAISCCCCCCCWMSCWCCNRLCWSSMSNGCWMPLIAGLKWVGTPRPPNAIGRTICEWPGAATSPIVPGRIKHWGRNVIAGFTNAGLIWLMRSWGVTLWQKCQKGSSWIAVYLACQIYNNQTWNN